MSDDYSKVTCPHCGQSIEYPTDSDAPSIPCPACSQTVPLREKQRVESEILVTAENRLAKLEKELRSAKRRDCGLLVGLALCLGIGIAGWTLRQRMASTQRAGAVQKEIHANKFLLEDENGKARALLYMDKNEPTLALSDENGKFSAFLTVNKNGPRLILSDENGKASAFLSVNKNEPSLEMYDETGEIRAVLHVSKNEPSLSLADEKGKVRAWLNVSENEPRLILWGKTTWASP
jgi:endogenous inhibitor of DNA gyrase (YacG/DUF329 family)